MLFASAVIACSAFSRRTGTPVAAARRYSAPQMATWDVRRFFQTAAFFNGPDQLLKRVLPQRTPERPDGLIWSAERPELLEWGPLDDVVMGGVSQSTFDRGVFSGKISTENNGGFAGCRSRPLTPPLRLRGRRGIRLAVRGDGKRYKFILRDSYDWNGIAWSFSFDTKKSDGSGAAQIVEAPFSAFVPTLFARTVPGATLNTDELSAVQLTLSKFEYDGGLNPAFSTGDFRLQVERIEAY